MLSHFRSQILIVSLISLFNICLVIADKSKPDWIEKTQDELGSVKDVILDTAITSLDKAEQTYNDVVHYFANTTVGDIAGDAVGSAKKLGHKIEEGAKSVGSQIESGAKKVWNGISGFWQTL